MIYRYASQDDIDDAVLPLDAADDVVLSLSHDDADDVVLSLSHDAAEEYSSC
jgi:hypothetical protein